MAFTFKKNTDVVLPAEDRYGLTHLAHYDVFKNGTWQGVVAKTVYRGRTPAKWTILTSTSHTAWTTRAIAAMVMGEHLGYPASDWARTYFPKNKED